MLCHSITGLLHERTVLWVHVGLKKPSLGQIKLLYSRIIVIVCVSVQFR